MPDYPTLTPRVSVSSLGRWSPMVATLAGRAIQGGSISFSVANRAYYHPIYLPFGCIVTQLWWINGTTGGGNVDCGVYSRAGDRLVSTGSTAQSGTNALQIVNVTDTILDIGWYYLAVACDSGSATAFGGAQILTGHNSVLGMAQEASAFPLPATATFAAPSTARLFMVGFTNGRIV